MSSRDPTREAGLHAATAAEMARLLRAAADAVEALPRCGEPEERLLLWHRLARHIAEFDTLLPERPEP
jgi:hypothetical protein